jgi:hypothetical protein
VPSLATTVGAFTGCISLVETGIFFTAEIYCNKDGIMNDDKYDYETIGYPFMKNLGNVIYDYEAIRKRAHYPDLSSMKIIYDK